MNIKIKKVENNEEYKNQLLNTMHLKNVISKCNNLDIIKDETFNGRSIPMKLERSNYEKHINFPN